MSATSLNLAEPPIVSWYRCLTLSDRDRKRWETKYADKAQAGEPRSTIDWLPPADDNQLALDLACGRGRHSLALVELGYKVVAMDIAMSALSGDSFAGNPQIFRVQADVEHWSLRQAAFDLIVQFDYLDRNALQAIGNSVRPGGLLLIDTFLRSDTVIDRFGPRNPEFRLAPGELERTFQDWEILHLVEQAAGPDNAARAAILVRRSE